MNRTYKILFDIKYNNKTFTIFIDNSNRRTFLEKDQNGGYIYPTLEDFKALSNIYNHHNPFVDSNPKKYFFKEKVRFTSGILAVTILSTAFTNPKGETFNNYKVEQTGDNVVVSTSNIKPQMTLITDLKELDDILGFSNVSENQILNAIDNNKNISDYYKEIMKDLIKKIISKYPNMDFRVFYENVKTLEIRELNEESFYAEFDRYTVANYESAKNRINLSPSADLKTIIHELVHTMWSFYWPDLGVYRVSSYVSLNEAMTNRLANIISEKINTYTTEELILNYLMSYSNFSYETYMQYGTEKLIRDLQKRYPATDFEYITNCLKSITDTNNKLGIEISLASCEELLDELFSLAVINIEKDNPYKNFVNFALLLEGNEELLDLYLNKFNNKLIELKYPIISKETLNNVVNEYQDFSYIIGTKDEQLFIGKPLLEEMNKYMILDGNETKIIDFSDITILRSFSNFNFLIQLAYLKYNDEINLQTFWQKMFQEYGNISEIEYKEVPIYINGKFLIKEKVSNLFIQVGETKENKLGFIIKNKNQEVIYASDRTLTNLSNYITLSSYMREYTKKDNKIELSYILNNYYLLDMQKNDQVFNNLMIVDKYLKVIPPYIITIATEENATHKDYLNSYVIKKGEKEATILPLTIPINIELKEDIYLYTILDYYHLLETKQTEYYFTLEELTTMIDNYINDLAKTKAR